MASSPSASPSTSPSTSPSASPSATPSTPFYSTDTAVGRNVTARAPLGLCSVAGTWEITNVLETGDVIHMVKIPAGATLLDLLLDVDDLDAGTDLLLSVGYTGALTAFISSSTVGQAGGVVRLLVAGGTQKLFAADDTIQVSATVGAGTTKTGTISLTVLYTMDP